MLWKAGRQCLAAARRWARGRRPEAALAGLTLLVLLLPGRGEGRTTGPTAPANVTPVPLTAVRPEAAVPEATPVPVPAFVPPDPAAPSVAVAPLRIVPAPGEALPAPDIAELAALAAAVRRHEELRLAAQADLAVGAAALAAVATPGRIAGIAEAVARLRDRGTAEVVAAHHDPELRRYTREEAVVVSRERSRTVLVDPERGSQVRAAVAEEQTVAWRLVRGPDGQWRVDDLALLTPPVPATGP